MHPSVIPLKVDLDLVRKYNVPGPRYTSYPPATKFREDVPVGLLEERIRENNVTPHPLSLYFHIPFCQSLCWYCGCTTVITKRSSHVEVYLRYLEKEMDQMRELLHPDRRVVQMHFGGGTPNFLSPEQIARLGEMIHTRFSVDSTAESGVELDPRTLTREHLSALRAAGFNRASVGVQDNNPEVQKAVHRIQPFSLTERAVEWLRELGYESVNIDLIYGLPFQTLDSFARTLEEVLTLKPNRFSVFNYAHVPWIKPAQRIIKEESLPSPETKLELLKLTIETLSSHGYIYIGMDHFAREDDDLVVAQKEGTLQRNFQGYSTCGGADIYGFGLSSISQADGVYWQNAKEMKPYYSTLDRGAYPFSKYYFLSEEDKIRRRTIVRLMCDLHLDYDSMSDELGIDFRAHFTNEIDSLADLEGDGLVQRSTSSLTVTELGRLFIRNIAMQFDPSVSTREKRRFSKTI